MSRFSDGPYYHNKTLVHWYISVCPLNHAGHVSAESDSTEDIADDAAVDEEEDDEEEVLVEEDQMQATVCMLLTKQRCRLRPLTSSLNNDATFVSSSGRR